MESLQIDGKQIWGEILICKKERIKAWEMGFYVFLLISSFSNVGLGSLEQPLQ